jgi:hypothetical protein
MADKRVTIITVAPSRFVQTKDQDKHLSLPNLNQRVHRLTFIEGFVEFNFFAIDGLNIEFNENGDSSHYNRTSYYSIHMKRLEMEHFLNAVQLMTSALIKGYQIRHQRLSI